MTTWGVFITRFSRRPCQTHSTVYLKQKYYRNGFFKIIFTHASQLLYTRESIVRAMFCNYAYRPQNAQVIRELIYYLQFRYKVEGALFIVCRPRPDSIRPRGSRQSERDVIASVSATRPRMRPVSIELTGGRVHCRLLPSYRERYRFFKMVV